MDAARPVELPNFECDPPLSEQDTIGLEKTELGVVDVGCFRGDAIQLNDLEVAARHEVLPRRNTNIKATEEEALEGFRYLIDNLLQCGGDGFTAVKENGTPAMGPDLNQLHTLSRRWHLVSPIQMLTQVEVRHTNRTVIRED
jgi:hypothetical protein